MEGLVSETKLLRHRVDGDVKIRKFRIKPVDKRQMSIAKGAFIFQQTGGGGGGGPEEFRGGSFTFCLPKKRWSA